MKIVGLITEYNPFHNGHLYHIEQAKRVAGADAVIVVMSGNFVQRGAPAIMPKHLRAKCALLSGASMVIELPVCYATASAESFAIGAVSLLDRLGIVDSICFGSECGEIHILEEIAEILTEEPEEYKLALREALKSGLSFPSARQKALAQYSQILSQPNNILGIEYLKALKKLDSSMKAYTISRAGASYHDTAFDEKFCSATAIRNQFGAQSRADEIPELKNQVPQNCYNLMQEVYGRRFPVQSNDFSLLLKAKLLTETPKSLTAYADVSEELANRIINRRNELIQIEQFCELLKTKELTYSRISRALFHILLGVTSHDMEAYRRSGFVFYARILGFRKKDASLFTKLKRHAGIPIITKLPQPNEPDVCAAAMLYADIYAADLYESVITDKYHTPFINERIQQIVKI